MHTTSTATIDAPPVQNAHFAAKRRFFDEGHTRGYSFRESQLRTLLKLLQYHESEICEALHADLHKGHAEAYLTEVGVLKAEVKHTLSHLSTWMATRKVSTPLVLAPGTSEVTWQPRGVVLIIAPWNYPFQLAIAPLIGAIAAGNCAVIKPSEETPHTSALLRRLVEQYFSTDYISVVEGIGQEIVPALLDAHRWDHVFFTGSPSVGSAVAQQCARALTPCTLELGGKSPGIVEQSAHLRNAARRLVFAKFTNAGQTCVAPDYLLVQEGVKDEFLMECTRAIRQFYGDDPALSPHYGRMVNRRHFDRVAAYIGQGRVQYGGQCMSEQRYIAPTILCDVDPDSPVMRNEIFGPVWPILTWREPTDLPAIISRNNHPLALYVFTRNKSFKEYVLSRTQFGGGCVNNALIHLGNPELPFGGLMSSGSGNYHGYNSFCCFSHERSMLHSPSWGEPNLKYPPYSSWTLKLLKRLMG
jgi:aldehyde dehydrogenase (NAD+)